MAPKLPKHSAKLDKDERGALYLAITEMLYLREARHLFEELDRRHAPHLKELEIQR